MSTEEQADSGLGLAAQRDAIRGECVRRGWDLGGIVEDAGYSAKDLRRPGIQRCLDVLAAGDADGLVVAKLDRLSRSMLDFASVMALAAREGWAIVLLDVAVDTTSPAGEMMANVMATFAQFERRLIGQRTRDALAARRRDGQRLGRPLALPEDVRARIIRERRAGVTLASIADGLNGDGVATAHGGVKWWPSTVKAACEAVVQ